MTDMPGGKCLSCGSSILVSHNLAACVDCIRDRPAEVMPYIRRIQDASRREFDLPIVPPRAPSGALCRICANECRIAPGQRGFCGLRTNRDGKLVHLAGTPRRGILHSYTDPLPTNCVAAWICGGREQHGYSNLAVFYGACTFNCLFCQNWQYRRMSPQDEPIPAAALAERAEAADLLQHLLPVP